jgi:threonine synthase
LLDRGTIDPNKSIVAIISGHGLKTLDAVVETAVVSSTIKPSLAEAEEALRFHQLVAAS